MIKRIKVDLEVIEAMHYYWHATGEKQKVGEGYINDISKMQQMKYLYDEEFNGESVRRALSAISNREIFSSKNRKEGRFWNNNMWMLEDLGYTDMMVTPLKTLNLNFLVEELLKEEINSSYEEINVVFLPGHLDEYQINKNKLIINFFRVKPSLYDDEIFVGEIKLTDFLKEKISEILKK